MANGDEHQQSWDELADLLTRHADQVAVPPQRLSGPAAGPVGTGITSAVGSNLGGLLKELGGSAANILKPPQMLTPEQRMSRMADTALLSNMPQAGLKAGGLVARKLMDVVRKNPNIVKTLLASIGALGTQTRPVQTQEGPASAGPTVGGGPTDIENGIEAGITKRLKEIEIELKSTPEQRTVTTPSGRTISTGGGKLKALQDEKRDLNQQLTGLHDTQRRRRELFLEEERPWLEKNAYWYDPAWMIGSGLLARELSAKETFDAMKGGAKFPSTAEQWKRALSYGGLGALEGFGEWAIPAGIDAEGKGRAKAESVDPLIQARNLGISAGADIGGSIIGSKLGFIKGAKQFGKLPPPPVLPSPTANIVKQVEPGPIRPVQSPKTGRWYDAGKPGNPTIRNMPRTPPPAAIAPPRRIPAEEVVAEPDENPQVTIPSLLKLIGGPEKR